MQLKESERLDVGEAVDLIYCTLEHVSLEDLTEDSREYMRNSGKQVYTPEAFWDRTQRKSTQLGRIHAISDENRDGRRRRLSKSEQLIDEWQSVPYFGRWTWGDYMALSYKLG
jgi:hypothetical protein